jgi:hypothetical protein
VQKSALQLEVVVSNVLCNGLGLPSLAVNFNASTLPSSSALHHHHHHHLFDPVIGVSIQELNNQQHLEGDDNNDCSIRIFGSTRGGCLVY